MESDINSSREASRQNMKRIWEHAKKASFADLNEEDRSLAEIMLDHKDEYFDDFESTDENIDRDFDPDTEQNPYMHIVMHQIVENQLKDKNPIEAYQFYNAMRRRKVSHHECIHLIAAIHAPFMFKVLKTKEAYDGQGYASQLVRFKSKKPEKIRAALDLE